MTDAINIRALALEVLLEVTEEGHYSHLVLRSVLEKYQYLDKKERAFLTRLTEGTIQRMIELDYIIDQFSKVKTNKQKPVIRAILRMSVYQMKYMDSVPASAACNEAVKLARKKGFASLSGFVNGVLRNIGRNLDQIAYPSEKEQLSYALSVRYSMPEWIVTQWLESYGEEKTRQMLAAFLMETPLTIRTNLSKTTPEELKQNLTQEGVTAELIDAAVCPELPYALTISGFDYLNRLKSFQEGLFYVQDISSMLVAEWAQPKPGDYCIDVCAAPGGKSIHLAEKLKGTGMVEARDLTSYKVEQIQANIIRCGLGNMKAVQKDATMQDADSVGRADVLLADLPCSGLGILRKKTDIKYKMSPKQQNDLVELQRQILDTVCTYVKEGGTLVYSTCTIHKAENEENVQWFLQKHPEFELEQMKQIFPQQALGDGFFIAKLRRTADR
jgi:16S rRNA (cytosine967-C5)-methyltransferase